MDKWVCVNEMSEIKIVAGLLRKLNYTGNNSCYMLSNPKYIYVNFDEKTFYIGCRHPSAVRSDEKMTLNEFLETIATNK